MLTLIIASGVLVALLAGFVCGKRYERGTLEAQMDSLKDECSRKVDLMRYQMQCVEHRMQQALESLKEE